MPTKFCPHCEDTRSTLDFQRNAARSDGLSGWCKICMREATARWKLANPEANRQHNRLWYYNKKLRAQV